MSNTLPITVTPTYTLFLPLSIFHVPTAPVIEAINNPNGLGTYPVQWSQVNGATFYELQEAKAEDFAGASQVYSGTLASHAVVGRGAARYSYRVRGGNQSWVTPWSSPQRTDVLWEAEPNNFYTQANGPLVSGLTYKGQFNPITDFDDYYVFVLAAAHTIEVWLTNIASGENYDLILRNDAGQIPGGYSGLPGNSDEHVLLQSMPPGRYYARVFNRSGTLSATPYDLRVMYR